MTTIRLTMFLLWIPLQLWTSYGILRASREPAPNLALHFAWMVFFANLLLPLLFVGEQTLGRPVTTLLSIVVGLITLGLYFSYNWRTRRKERDDRVG